MRNRRRTRLGTEETNRTTRPTTGTRDNKRTTNDNGRATRRETKRDTNRSGHNKTPRMRRHNATTAPTARGKFPERRPEPPLLREAAGRDDAPSSSGASPSSLSAPSPSSSSASESSPSASKPSSPISNPSPSLFSLSTSRSSSPTLLSSTSGCSSTGEAARLVSLPRSPDTVERAPASFSDSSRKRATGLKNTPKRPVAAREATERTHVPNGARSPATGSSETFSGALTASSPVGKAASAAVSPLASPRSGVVSLGAPSTWKELSSAGGSPKVSSTGSLSPHGPVSPS